MSQGWRLYNLDRRESIKFSYSELLYWYFYRTPTTMLNTIRSGDGSWSGDRVICLGDRTRVDDLPAGMLSNDELISLGFTKDALTSGKDAANDKELNVTSVLNSNFTVIPEPDSYRGPKLTHSVIRNLSKKEFIRGDNQPMPLYRTISMFGQAFFAKILWSSDPSTGLEQPKGMPELTRGAWAGDRFDLAPMEEVQDSLEGWKDVTDEVKALVEKFVKVNYCEWEGVMTPPVRRDMYLSNYEDDEYDDE